MDTVVGKDVHKAPEQLFEILLEPDEVEKRAVVFHLDQKVDVTVGSVVTSRDGTEHAHVARAVLRGYAEDLVGGLGQLS